MSRNNNDEQFKFLISCIRHANNSKVDFSAVAKECGIVSKGAASVSCQHDIRRPTSNQGIRELMINPPSTSSAKRYERMMKAHGISPTTPPARTTPAPPTARRDDSTQAKKRKLEQFAGEMENSAVDDDGGIVGIKDEFGTGDMGSIWIKEEDPDLMEIIDGTVSSFSAETGTSFEHPGSRSNFSSYVPVPAFQEYGFESLGPQVQRAFPLDVGSSAGGKATPSGNNGNNMAMSEAILISD